jgi:hypothetical protein
MLGVCQVLGQILEDNFESFIEVKTKDAKLWSCASFTWFGIILSFWSLLGVKHMTFLSGVSLTDILKDWVALLHWTFFSFSLWLFYTFSVMLLFSFNSVIPCLPTLSIYPLCLRFPSFGTNKQEFIDLVWLCTECKKILFASQLYLIIMSHLHNIYIYIYTWYGMTIHSCFVRCNYVVQPNYFDLISILSIVDTTYNAEEWYVFLACWLRIWSYE